MIQIGLAFTLFLSKTITGTSGSTSELGPQWPLMSVKNVIERQWRGNGGEMEGHWE